MYKESITDITKGEKIWVVSFIFIKAFLKMEVSFKLKLKKYQAGRYSKTNVTVYFYLTPA
jgi:hypothetical protein